MLQAALPPADFATWLAPSMLLSLERAADHAHAVIGVQNVFVREQVLASYLTPLIQTLVLLLGTPVTVQIEIDASVCGPLALVDAPDVARPAARPRYARSS
jgi:chromosomal replication initiation ATPase DnaA